MTIFAFFSQKSCLTNIGEDLQHYYKLLAAQPDPDSLLGPSVLSSLRELMKVTHFTATVFSFTVVLPFVPIL